ncbi:hypothetical protein [Staphylococcus cornubiensis]|uniref:hypothetical protein n=1 Tax=Staphylococcus cornubiensis TaxID=1986155 RepID=UPI000A378F5C|nr:hypothetical protein [Staphylococcus cornubiensis]
MLTKENEKKSGCSGCFGCLGIVLLIILLFSGCSAFFGDSHKDKDHESPKTEEKSKKEEKSPSKEEKENTEIDNSKADLTVEKVNIAPEDDTVYGKLSQPHNNNNSVVVVDDVTYVLVVVDDVTYVLGENDEILQAEKSFSKLPLDKNLDKNFLNEHAKDYMAKDAEFVSNITDTEQKYHSKSLNKDYFVTLVLNEHGNVNQLIVSSRP